MQRLISCESSCPACDLGCDRRCDPGAPPVVFTQDRAYGRPGGSRAIGNDAGLLADRRGSHTSAVRPLLL